MFIPVHYFLKFTVCQKPWKLLSVVNLYHTAAILSLVSSSSSPLTTDNIDGDITLTSLTVMT